MKNERIPMGKEPVGFTLETSDFDRRLSLQVHLTTEETSVCTPKPAAPSSWGLTNLLLVQYLS